jgi:hypothetical protein
MMGHELRHLAPHKSVFDLNEPKVVSGNLSMPKPVIASISNWMHSVDNIPTTQQMANMAALPEAP